MKRGLLLVVECAMCSLSVRVTGHRDKEASDRQDKVKEGQLQSGRGSLGLGLSGLDTKVFD